jgi:hypothetical protein
VVCPQSEVHVNSHNPLIMVVTQQHISFHPAPCRLHMNLAIAPPHHGWLPVTLEVDARQFSFGASNVVNDPASELLAAALWLAAPDNPLPPVNHNVNPPYVDDDVRGVHFWLEPVWHTLLIQRLDNGTDARFVFYDNHDGGLIIGPDNFRTSKQTLFDRLPISEFCIAVHQSLTDIADKMAPALYDRHWGRPFSQSHLVRLGAVLAGS